MRNSVIVRVPSHYVFVRSCDNFASEAFIPKLGYGLADVGEIPFDRDVMLVGLQDTVIMPLKKQLAGLGSYRLEMPG